MMMDDDVKARAHVIIINGIKEGLSDQEIVKQLKKEKIFGWSEEDVARVRESQVQ
jgi:hypothetical protein